MHDEAAGTTSQVVEKLWLNTHQASTMCAWCVLDECLTSQLYRVTGVLLCFNVLLCVVTRSVQVGGSEFLCARHCIVCTDRTCLAGTHAAGRRSRLFVLHHLDRPRRHTRRRFSNLSRTRSAGRWDHSGLQSAHSLRLTINWSLIGLGLVERDTVRNWILVPTLSAINSGRLR